jgi:hypothetical protein
MHVHTATFKERPNCTADVPANGLMPLSAIRNMHLFCLCVVHPSEPTMQPALAAMKCSVLNECGCFLSLQLQQMSSD